MGQWGKEVGDTVNAKEAAGISLGLLSLAPQCRGQILSYILDKMIEKRHPWLFYSRANVGSNGLLYFDPKV